MSAHSRTNTVQAMQPISIPIARDSSACASSHALSEKSRTAVSVHVFACSHVCRSQQDLKLRVRQHLSGYIDKCTLNPSGFPGPLIRWEIDLDGLKA
jgi:hypothetical protein